jgi:hypothetical protein
MSIRPPPTTTFRVSFSSLLTVLAAVPIGLWVNFLSSSVSPTTDLMGAMKLLGWTHGYLAVGILLSLLNLYAQFRWDTQDSNWQQFLTGARARRDLRSQLRVLEMYCRALEGPLQVPVSARLFSIKHEKRSDGKLEARMYQVRDVFVEHEVFPQEIAFTYVPMTGDAFVSARAFRERAPKYEILPVDHPRLYGTRERRMVDPAQRWVLCGPILQYDYQGQARDELEPTGMVVFYGKETPKLAKGNSDFALALCRDTAELFSTMGSPSKFTIDKEGA